MGIVTRHKRIACCICSLCDFELLESYRLEASTDPRSSSHPVYQTFPSCPPYSSIHLSHSSLLQFTHAGTALGLPVCQPLRSHPQSLCSASPTSTPSRTPMEYHIRCPCFGRLHQRIPTRIRQHPVVLVKGLPDAIAEQMPQISSLRPDRRHCPTI